MMDFRDIDWQSDCPDPIAVASDWDRTVITPIRQTDEKIRSVVRALVSTHVNGGAKIAQFEIDAAPAVRWALSRNRWNEFDLLGRFFRHTLVKEILPPVERIKPTICAFQMEGTLTAFGRLADWIREGGAYRKFNGSDEAALKLATGLMESVCEKRFSETNTWVNWMPWTDWFLDVAWDGTFLWFDTRRGIATVLMVTDTD
ncbi:MULTISPECIES: hypothetical protein [unclassified Novosphingobium]|uniref:hypothetical protein n=2 Tax=Novosphingobium TaxID=165696 RepID=UPI00146E08BE|nr:MULTISPECIES: hypothetical protein [unclassified Novosphingobium]NKJ42915.1 hypothetical protein [Novosphingobium sp. SG720]NMN05447.1 hypothetical protein [Novosphingobium sp. SG919]NMN88194.1 hypothetical protein [Novosphingobium sp. SG916]